MKESAATSAGRVGGANGRGVSARRAGARPISPKSAPIRRDLSPTHASSSRDDSRTAISSRAFAAISIEQRRRAANRAPRRHGDGDPRLHAHLWRGSACPTRRPRACPFESQDRQHDGRQAHALPDGERLYQLAPVVRAARRDQRSWPSGRSSLPRVKIDGMFSPEDAPTPQESSTTIEGVDRQWSQAGAGETLRRLHRAVLRLADGMPSPNGNVEDGQTEPTGAVSRVRLPVSGSPSADRAQCSVNNPFALSGLRRAGHETRLRRRTDRGRQEKPCTSAVERVAGPSPLTLRRCRRWPGTRLRWMCPLWKLPTSEGGRPLRTGRREITSSRHNARKYEVGKPLRGVLPTSTAAGARPDLNGVAELSRYSREAMRGLRGARLKPRRWPSRSAAANRRVGTLSIATPASVQRGGRAADRPARRSPADPEENTDCASWSTWAAVHQPSRGSGCCPAAESQRIRLPASRSA